ncbi:hypothetical protein VP01_432g6 [Puccinia sorghi]|uniref:Uncharacterized protein n=1 Tax=Puccinia sorghi TaxID=27349 RepID=A0A0L6UPZ6_9BASI|nr:hypothetical protein VP01_432g6 [Puccinia sorghi]
MSGLDVYIAEGSLPDVSKPPMDKLTKRVDTVLPRLDNMDKVVSDRLAQLAGPAWTHSIPS